MLHQHRQHLRSRKVLHQLTNAVVDGDHVLSERRESMENSELEVASILRHLSVWYARAGRLDDARGMAKEVRERRRLRRTMTASS